ncbi:MAG: DUF5131 family protein [Solirubrobacteraceae bacterium]
MPGPTKIEWAQVSWNPTTGCDKVSPGCARSSSGYRATVPNSRSSTVACVALDEQDDDDDDDDDGGDGSDANVAGGHGAPPKGWRTGPAEKGARAARP